MIVLGIIEGAYTVLVFLHTNTIIGALLRVT